MHVAGARGPAFGDRLRQFAPDYPHPARALMLAMIDRRKRKTLGVCVGDAFAPFGRLHPYAAHGRNDFAAAVRPHAAARSVAHLLGAIGGTGHARRGEHALAAHFAVEQEALGRALERGEQTLGPRRPDLAHQRCKIGGSAGTGVVEALQSAGMPHAPMTQRFHDASAPAPSRFARIVLA